MKENINKVEINEIENKSRIFNDSQTKNQEILVFSSKIKSYEKLIFDMKEVLKKKQNLLTFKRNVNRLLIELLQLKKSEISCLDDQKNNINNEKALENFGIIREKEKILLNR